MRCGRRGARPEGGGGGGPAGCHCAPPGSLRQGLSAPPQPPPRAGHERVGPSVWSKSSTSTGPLRSGALTPGRFGESRPSPTRSSSSESSPSPTPSRTKLRVSGSPATAAAAQCRRLLRSTGSGRCLGRPVRHDGLSPFRVSIVCVRSRPCTKAVVSCQFAWHSFGAALYTPFPLSLHSARFR